MYFIKVYKDGSAYMADLHIVYGHWDKKRSRSILGHDHAVLQLLTHFKIDIRDIRYVDFDNEILETSSFRFDAIFPETAKLKYID